MHVTIRLAPEIAPIIQQVATEKGQDVASFLEEFVQEAFTVPLNHGRSMRFSRHFVPKSKPVA